MRFSANNNAIIDNLRLERTGDKTEHRYIDIVPGTEDPPGCVMRR
mgnify:CR=1 FL=1